MLRHIFFTLTFLSLSSNILAQNNSNFKFSKDLHISEDGCSEAYFKKAKKFNRIVGASVGTGALAISSLLPLSWVFMMGGLGAIGESAFDLGHQKFNDQFVENLNIKNIQEKIPLIRYPIARDYFDILNSIELSNKIINNQSHSAEYLKIYIQSSVLALQIEKQYKTCKSHARLAGLSYAEIKDVESNLMQYLVKKEENLTSYGFEAVRQKFASCLINLKLDEKNDIYPIADMLLAKHELAGSDILNWKIKGIIRLYNYVYRKAQEENKIVNIEFYLSAISKLDHQYSLCKDLRDPLKKDELAQEILSTLTI